MAEESNLTPQILRPGDPLEAWDRFVDESPQGCIFCRSWWLDAVCSSGFGVLTVQKNGKIAAGIPLASSRKLIWTGITMPPLTHTLGVLLASQPKARYFSRLSGEMAALQALVAAIPRFDFFRVNMHHTMTNWLPFYWAGYSQTTRYTYVLEDLSDLDAVFKNMRKGLRRTIRKAEEAGIRVEETDDIDTLLELNKKTFTRQGRAVPYTDESVRKLDAACAQHDARKILVTKDGSNRPHSALYLVYDSRFMYSLMEGTDPECRSSGACPLAIRRSLELAHTLNLGYDFVGSMLEGVEFCNRSFGATQKPYFEISRWRAFAAKAANAFRQLAK